MEGLELWTSWGWCMNCGWTTWPHSGWLGCHSCCWCSWSWCKYPMPCLNKVTSCRRRAIMVKSTRGFHFLLPIHFAFVSSPSWQALPAPHSRPWARCAKASTASSSCPQCRPGPAPQLLPVPTSALTTLPSLPLTEKQMDLLVSQMLLPPSRMETGQS